MFEVVRALLQLVQDKCSREDQEAPLTLAASNPNNEILEMLIKSGAD